MSKSFSDPAAWTKFSTKTLTGAAYGFDGMGWDGRYLYYTPYYSNSLGAYIGTVLRYDTLAAFDVATSWCSFDMASLDTAAKGYGGAVFDGSNMYFVPTNSGVPAVRYFAKTPKALPAVPAGFTGSFRDRVEREKADQRESRRGKQCATASQWQRPSVREFAEHER